MTETEFILLMELVRDEVKKGWTACPSIVRSSLYHPSLFLGGDILRAFKFFVMTNPHLKGHILRVYWWSRNKEGKKQRLKALREFRDLVLETKFYKQLGRE